MSQHALDLKSSIQAVRRHSKLFWAIIVLGLLLGAFYAALKPPPVTSSALVVLPQAGAQSQQVSSGEANTEVETQVVVAGSAVVLADALPHISPAVSLQTLESRVQVTNPAGSILSFSASGDNAAAAVATANAVAESYITYTTSKHSAAGSVPAKMLQPATTATGKKLPERIAIYGLLGVIAGIIVGFIVAIATNGSDRRLRERDEIANSIGVPVLASVPVARPSDATSWAKLMEEYEPGVVHAWGLTRLLQQLGVAGSNGTVSLTVLSLASDPKSLALGPQLAAFAAARGIRTALLMGPQQDTNVTAPLRTACAVSAQSSAGRQERLQLGTREDGDHLGQLDASFIVVVAVVDDRAPVLPNSLRTAATVLGVSAGGATAEQLARAATAAAVSGREVAGILVADPEPGDQSTGRIPRLAPAVQRHLPTRVNDVATEIKPTEIKR
jgi:capsular polysaccharide biosynthesis protein